MTKHKVAALTGPMLDAAVALAEGKHPYNYTNKWCLIVDEQEDETVVYEPSLDWELGGPIIEREQIALKTPRNEPGRIEPSWYAHVCPVWTDDGGISSSKGRGHGDTPLLAAMRAFVASRLGPEVEL